MLDAAALAAIARSLPGEVASRAIFVLGGIGVGQGLVRQVDLYDPLNNTWTPSVSEMPTPRFGFRAVALQNRIYLIGGVDQSGATTTSVESYDPVANSWRVETPMPQRLTGFVAGVVGTSIVVLGGTTTTDMTTGTLSSQVYRFNPTSGGGVWSTQTSGTPIPTHIDMSGCAIDGGLFFGLGRLHSSGAAQSSHDTYLASANSTTALAEAAFSASRFGAASACYAPGGGDPVVNSDRMVFAVGGSVQASTAFPPAAITPSDVVDYYVAGAGNTMSQTAALPAEAFAPAAAISYVDGRLYVFGGASAATTPAGVVHSLGIASVASNAWRSDHPLMPQPRYYHAAVTLRP